MFRKVWRKEKKRRDEGHVAAAMHCVICQSTLVPAESLTLPECGHQFHGECVAQWFRLSSPSCPLCREIPQQLQDRQSRNDWESTSNSSSSSTEWEYVTPAEAHRQVWRLLAPLSRTQPRLVRRYRAIWTRLKEQRHHLLAFRRTARGRFRDLRRREQLLHRRVQYTTEVHIGLVNELLGWQET